MLGAIWYHLYNLENVENSNGGVLLLVKLQTKACNFNKSNTPSWVFFMFFLIVKMLPNREKHHKISKNALLTSMRVIPPFVTCYMPHVSKQSS